jgi:hypothetical protein
MKKWVSIALLVVVGFFALNMECPNGGSAPTNVAVEVIDDNDGNPGGAVKVTWSAPGGDAGVPDEYIVYVDGVGQIAVETTEDMVYGAGAEITVAAVYGSEEYESSPVDLGAVETPTLDVWTVNDPDPAHPSGFGFNTIGTVSAYAVSDQSNWPEIDFYLASGPNLAAPKDHLPDPINSKGSASSTETGNYDDLDIVAATGQGLYLTNRDLASNGLYGLWLDDDDDGYTADDHFGKAHVTGIDGEKVTFKLALQLEPGLRWVVVD